jgi:hypothetical protein
MIQLKSIRCFDARLENPFFNTVFDRERRPPISKGDIMSPFLQPPTEIQCRIRRTCPFLVAKKVKDLHDIESPYESSIDQKELRLKEKVIILNLLNLMGLFF